MLAPARALALALPAALMAGALGSQYLGGLSPCEMCHWQRWPHYAAIIAALAAIGLRKTTLGRPLLILAGLLILTSGLIGGFHAGVEYRWWDGPQHCTAGGLGGGDPLAAILAAPVIMCDVPQWTLGGVSLAGFNFLFSVAGGIAVILMATRKRAR